MKSYGQHIFDLFKVFVGYKISKSGKYFKQFLREMKIYI